MSILNFFRNKEVEDVYKKIYPEINGYRKVFNGDKYGLIDKDNREVLKCKYDVLFSTSENFCVFGEYNDEKIKDDEKRVIEIKRYEKRGVVNLKGKIIIEAKYEDMFFVKNGLIQGTYNNEKIFINIKTKEVFTNFEECFRSIPENIKKEEKEVAIKNNEKIKSNKVVLEKNTYSKDYFGIK